MSYALKVLICFYTLSVCPVLNAELEGEVPSKPLCVFRFTEFAYFQPLPIKVPIVISVSDPSGNPIVGVTVALMRLEPGGYTEADLQMATNPRTNASGIAVLQYPVYSDDNTEYDLIGAVTIFHPEFGVSSIELQDRYRSPLDLSDTSMTPWVRIQISPHAKNPNAAEQDGHGDGE